MNTQQVWDRLRRPAAQAAFGCDPELRNNSLCGRDPLLRRRLHGPSARSGAYAAELLRRLRSTRPEVDATLLIAALNGLKLEWLAEGERSAFAARIPALARRLSELFLPGPA